MKTKIIDIEVFTFTEVAQKKLKRLGFQEIVFNNEKRGTRSYEILLSHESFSEVHLFFTEVLDEDIFRKYESQRQIKNNLMFKPRIIVRQLEELSKPEVSNKQSSLISLSPVSDDHFISEQIQDDLYGFTIAHEKWIGQFPLVKAESSAQLQMICIHPKLLQQELRAEDFLEIPFYLFKESDKAALYFQLRKESGCVALVLDNLHFAQFLLNSDLPRFQFGGQEYWHIKENPLDVDLLIPLRMVESF